MAAILIGMALLGGSSAWAVDYNTYGGDWSTEGTWSPAAPAGGPTSSDTAQIYGTLTVDVNASGQINWMNINNGGSLVLDAMGLTAAGSINVYNGGTLNLGDQTLAAAGNIQFGGNGGPGAVTRGTGSMSASWIGVSEGSQITLGAGDTSAYLQVWGNYWNGSEYVFGSATTAATGNVTNWATVDSCELTLGAAMSLSESFRVGGANDQNRLGVLKMNGQTLTAPNIQLGGNGAGRIERTTAAETLTASWIGVSEGSQLTMIAGDSCQYLQVYGSYWNGSEYVFASATTAATSNVSNWIQVDSCELTLGADVSLTESFRVGGANDQNRLGVVKMNGHAINAPNIQLGGNGAGRIERSTAGETLTADSIYVSEGSQLTMIAGDSCKYLQVGSSYWNGSEYVFASATTAATSNVSNWIQVDSCELTLGADVSLTESFRVGGSNDQGRLGMVKMNGHSITAPTIDFGGNGAGTSDGTGKVFAQYLRVYEGSTGKVKGGTVSSNVQLWNDASILEVIQAGGQTDGLSLDSSSNAALTISGTGSLLKLTFDGDASSGIDYGFRWLGDHDADLEALHAAGQLTWTSANAVDIWFEAADGYTYVGYLATASAFHPGDANGDGTVDLQDFGLLKENFGATTGALWGQGDFNADGAIDLQDFGILKEHFGHTNGSVPMTAVPEPASLSLLALGAAALVRRYRRK